MAWWSALPSRQRGRWCLRALFHNRDDHPKNFSFRLNRERQWELSPCYDLTFCDGPGGEHQNRGGAPFAQLDQHVLAVAVRQAEVEHDQVGLAGGAQAQALGGRLGLQYRVALAAQADAQELANLRFVVDHQNGRCQGHAGVSSAG